MRVFLAILVLALLVVAVVAQAPKKEALDVNGFPFPPQVPKNKVLIVPADKVAVAQTRIPGKGTGLYNGGTFSASGLKRVDAEEGPVKHMLKTEVYVMQGGSGMYTSGGTLVGPFEEHPGTPDAQFGKTIQGGETKLVKAGDVVVIPPGVPHQFTKINQPVTYINVQFQAK